jgi:hypothetical protein
VERALTLVATGTLTIEMTRGKRLTLPRTFNLATGRKRSTGFSDSTWGKASRRHARSASELSKEEFDAIVDDARDYALADNTDAMEITYELLDSDEECSTESSLPSST